MVINKNYSKKRMKPISAKGVKGSKGVSKGDVGNIILASDETDGNKIVQMIYDAPDPTSYDS